MAQHWSRAIASITYDSNLQLSSSGSHEAEPVKWRCALLCAKNGWITIITYLITQLRCRVWTSTDLWIIAESSQQAPLHKLFFILQLPLYLLKQKHCTNKTVLPSLPVLPLQLSRAVSLGRTNARATDTTRTTAIAVSFIGASTRAVLSPPHSVSNVSAELFTTRCALLACTPGTLTAPIAVS